MAFPMRANAQRDDCVELEGGNIDLAMVDWLADYYAGRVQRRWGSEQRLPGGVVWRLETDAATKLGLPRIVAMPDGAAMRKANRLLDALRGCLLLADADGHDMDHAPGPSEEPYDFSWQAQRHGRPMDQPERLVNLTYASSRLVSFSQVHIAWTRPQWTIALIGVVLDLEQDRMVSVTGCDDAHYPFSLSDGFRLGDFLEVCDEDAHARFIAVWERALSAVEQTPLYRQLAGEEVCRLRWPGDDGIGNFRYSLSLTSAGLAMYIGHWWPTIARHCMVEPSPFNPLIIPWQELQSFLRPGSWYDELLR